MTNNKAPPTDLKVVTKKSPVSARKISQQTWKRFSVLCDLADRIVKAERELDSYRFKITHVDDDAPFPDPMFVTLSQDELTDLARCRELINEFDSDVFYELDDEGDRVLKEDLIINRLTMMMVAVSGGKPMTDEEAAGFAEMLVAQVRNLEPSRLVLGSACRAIEDREKWSQKIAEVTAEIKKQDKRWRGRHQAIDCVEHVSAIVEKEAEKARTVWQLNRARNAVDEAALNLANARRNLNRYADAIIEKQEAARAAYQGAQSAVIAYAKGKEEVDEWTAKLAMAQAALAALKPTKQIATVPDA